MLYDTEHSKMVGVFLELEMLGEPVLGGHKINTSLLSTILEYCCFSQGYATSGILYPLCLYYYTLASIYIPGLVC